MFRTLLVTVALLGAATPVHAQVRDELTSGAWSCRMTSLSDAQGMDVNMTFDPDGSLDGWFLAEIPDGGDTVGIEFTITGTWMLEDGVITSSATDGELIGGTRNGENLPAEEFAEMAGALDELLSSISGESTIAYIAPHAMVLDEEDASISRWR